jgi:hypothetical protein
MHDDFMRWARLLLVVLCLTLAGCLPLSPYQGQVVDDSGAAVAGATIRVTATNAPATTALIFHANGMLKANPFTADAEGRFVFHAQSGSYNIQITGPGFSRTLVDVAVADRRAAHTVTGSNAQPPLRLVESSAVTAAGNAALVLERRRADGSLVYGPWSLHANKGAASRPAELRWLYNTDWNEAAQAATGRTTADVAYAMTLAPRGATVAPHQEQPFAFQFDYAPSAAAGTAPVWQRIFRSDESFVPALGTLASARVGSGPFVVGDGLASSSLIARRVGWDTYQTTAPAGVLMPVELVEPAPSPGEVVVPVVRPQGDATAERTDQHAQLDASVYLRHGNGSYPSLLGVGKALVRVASAVAVAPGDLVVSSGVEAGRATVDNTVTEPRSIVGFALEAAGQTLPGYVAIVRSSR